MRGQQLLLHSSQADVRRDKEDSWRAWDIFRFAAIGQVRAYYFETATYTLADFEREYERRKSGIFCS